jgi:GTPase Era involved in 16S rRNA processing
MNARQAFEIAQKKLVLILEVEINNIIEKILKQIPTRAAEGKFSYKENFLLYEHYSLFASQYITNNLMKKLKTELNYQFSVTVEETQYGMCIYTTTDWGIN